MTGEYNDIVQRICIGVAQDIDDNADLPAHQTVLFRRPKAVFPDDCPLLTVWLLQKVWAPDGSFKQANAIGLGISWQEEGVERASTLIDDPYRAMDLLTNIAKIEHRVRVMGAMIGDPTADVGIPGVPEVDMVFARNTDFIEPQSVETGLVEGYAITVEVDVRE